MIPLRTVGTAVMVVLGLSVFGQTERAAFTQSGHGASLTFATDYQCVGINPANLGWKRKFSDKRVTMGFGELGYSMYTTAFDRAGFKDDFVGTIIDSDVPDFTYAGKVDASKRFTDAPLAMNGDAMLFGISWQKDSIGGFAFVVRDRMQWYTKFNREVSELMFQGFWAPYFETLMLDSIGGPTIPNDGNVTDDQRARTVRGGTSNGRLVSDIMNNSAYDFLWYREYGLSYGRMISGKEGFELYGGLGIKYLQGFGVIDIQSDGSKLTARNALSPGFKVDYGDDAATNPSYRPGTKMEPVGSGFAMDVGFSALIAGKLKLALSYVDIGSITWDGNVWVADDGTLDVLEENGFDNYSFFDQAGNFTSDVGIYDWEGRQEEKIDLPSTLRTGAGYLLGDKLEVGAEVVVPMNDAPGGLRTTVIALGGDFRPLPWLSLNAGLTTGGIYAARVPMGVVFITPSGSYEAGVSTRDVVSLAGGGDPTLSACFGFLRFRL